MDAIHIYSEGSLDWLNVGFRLAKTVRVGMYDINLGNLMLCSTFELVQFGF